MNMVTGTQDHEYRSIYILQSLVALGLCTPLSKGHDATAPNSNAISRFHVTLICPKYPLDLCIKLERFNHLELLPE